ncbi:hypothetical protein BI364_08860 [Acidihalobacter yilgarnensis]|uniref:HTH merR-type domain-containing protein n=1 Tax=Acidihalobacter yilgarnensis TaxID=2819280 RepID=A0A1D8INL5_9GAMM|nr:MerR family transcriptional regulator [Acidihalobacter yilgarnensis]AOU98057.1 hypothetical protein BI364_08860 [Acidihalobacter yilgarnensis]
MNTDGNPTWTIGRLAAAAGVHVETVRYYQRRSLLPIPSRGYGSIRRYCQEDLERLNFIRHAQQAGFSLHEIAELLALGEKRCHEIQMIAERRLKEVSVRIESLHRVEHQLSGLIDACKRGGEMDTPIDCPLYLRIRED